MATAVMVGLICTCIFYIVGPIGVLMVGLILLMLGVRASNED